YPEPTGAPELRTALAAHLRRVRGVEADPRAIVITAGAAQGFALLTKVLGDLRIAVEDPCLPHHREILQAGGAALVALPVDDDGARVRELPALAAHGGPI